MRKHPRNTVEDEEDVLTDFEPEDLEKTGEDGWSDPDEDEPEHSGHTRKGGKRSKAGRLSWYERVAWNKIGILLLVLAVAVGAVLAVLAFVRTSKKKSLYADAKNAIAQGDYQNAAAKLEQAIEYGSKDAKYLLGTLYLNGDGVEKDETKGQALCNEAFEEGSDYAYYCRAMEDLEEYVDTGDAAKLSDCQNKLEQSDEPDATYQRSLLLRVSGDADGADQLLETAVKGGSLGAICDQAQYKIYAGDYDGALDVLKKYAYQDDLDLQATTAWVKLHQGDTSSWQNLINLANNGCGLANAYLGDIYYDGLIAGQERDFGKAAQYYQIASKADCMRGRIGLSLTMLVNGNGYYEKSFAVAVNAYRRGYVNAGSILGNLMYEGLGTEEKHEGMQYIIAAANNCYAPAEMYLASYYYKEGDTDKCYEYLERAYKHDSRADANRNLEAYLGNSDGFGADTFY